MIESYQYLLESIESSRDIISQIEKELRKAEKDLKPHFPSVTAKYGAEPGTAFISVPLDLAWERVRRLKERLAEERSLLGEKLDLKRKIEDRLRTVEGIEAKMLYLKIVRGMKPTEIVQELVCEGFIGERWAWEIWGRLKEKLA